eukprot:GEZU01009437.1.p1 GENE.GEZU01009437.1~~GEZU01009437.1.p1  ORF type:complete len:135 (+),score=20.27 GEZU01009437.1:70-474(+)
MANPKVIAGGVTIGLGFLLGFFLCILGCALYRNWWSMFVLFLYVFTPVPDMLFGKSFANKDPLGDNSTTFFNHFGALLTGFFAVSSLALCVMLAHIQVVPWQTMLFVLSSGIVFYLTAIIGAVLIIKGKEDDEF